MTFHIGVPQAILLGLLSLEMAWAIANDGRPRQPVSAMARIFDTATYLGLIYWGGFFNQG